MEREVKVRIDLVLDNQASLLDTVKAINEQVDRLEQRSQRLKSLQQTGNYQSILNAEIDLLRKKNSHYMQQAVANRPVADAERLLTIERQIFDTQEKRRQLTFTRPHEIRQMVEEEYLARDRAQMVRAAKYQAKFGTFGPAMSVVDRMTMSGMGYAAMSGGMMAATGSAGSTTINTLLGAMKRAAGEIGLTFIPALMNLAQWFHNFGMWFRDLSPTIKSVIGNLATYGLALSAGAKVISMFAHGIAAIRDLFTGLSLSGAAGALTVSAGNLTAAAVALEAAAVSLGAGGGSSTIRNSAGSGVAGAAAGGGMVAAAAAAAVAALAVMGYSTYRYITNTPEQRAKEGLYASSNLAELGMRGLGKLFGWKPFADEPDTSPRKPPLPLSIPGFQSQQFDIFALKDMVQRESLRDPNEKANFELAVREFHDAVKAWQRHTAGLSEDRGTAEMGRLLFDAVKAGFDRLIR